MFFIKCLRDLKAKTFMVGDKISAVGSKLPTMSSSISLCILSKVKKIVNYIIYNIKYIYMR